MMIVSDKESDELEKLLADVQRTIKDNDQFIRHLKEEAADSKVIGEEVAGNESDEDQADFEEL